MKNLNQYPRTQLVKLGLIGLARWLATWLGHNSVRVNVLTPGYTIITLKALIRNILKEPRSIEWQSPKK